MNWKDLSISKKISIGIGTSATLLLIVSIQSYSGINGLLSDASEVIKGNKMDAMITQKQLDHMKWSSNVVELFTNDEITTLDVEKNHKECGLGKWLYSSERQEAEKLIPELAPLLRQLEEPHKNLHESAKIIDDVFVQDHGDLAHELASRREDHIGWVSSLGQSIAEEAGSIYTYQNTLQAISQQAFSIVQSVANNESIESIEERQEIAKSRLNDLRYGDDGKGYFFVLDTECNMLAHPMNSAQVGQNIRESVDVNNTKYVQNMVDVCLQKGKGFTTYYYALPGTETVVPKISYVTLYEPWNWVIGTGIYVDHTNEKLLERVEEFANGLSFSSGVELNPTQCAFGKMLKDPHIKDIADNFPEFKKILNQLVEPHNHLHGTAANIEDCINNTQMSEAIRIFQNDTQSDLSKIKTLFEDAINAEKEFSSRMDEAETVYHKQTVPVLEEVHELLEEIRQVAKDNIQTDQKMLLNAKSTRYRTVLTSLLALVLSIILIMVISKAISRPILKTVDFVKKISSGDLTATADIQQKDEVGVLISSLDNMAKNLNDMMLEISSSSNTLSNSSTELAATSSQLASNSSQMTEKAGNVLLAGEELSGGISTIATATEELSLAAGGVASSIEEMTSTIAEITRNCVRETEIVQNANTETHQTQEMMIRLKNSANEIGKIVEIITQIATQTNLLALNATIEAASAGEAGKGFAVVAGEVKELARQTADATDKIATQIKGIQTDTVACEQAIERVVTCVDEVHQISDTIASAIEEQSVTTNEISKNISHVSATTNEVSKQVAQSAKDANEVSENIHYINTSAEQVSTGASETNTSSESLSNMAENLNSIVSKFKVSS